MKFYNIDTSAQCYKTFFVRDLQIRVLVPSKPFQPRLLFVGEARSLP
jgi:hypothetical protein